MKVKNIMFSGAMASILMIGGAYAAAPEADTALATAGFVRGGVNYAIEQANGYTDTEIAKHDQLSEMVDVSVDGATNGQVLMYNSTNNKWESADVAEYTLGAATTDTLGGVMADGSTISVDTEGVISVGTIGISNIATDDIDGTVTADSTNLVTSGAVATGLAAKANTADLGDLAAMDDITSALVTDFDTAATTAAKAAISGTGAITVTNGVVSVADGSSSAKGAVQVDGTTMTAANGVISVGSITSEKVSDFDTAVADVIADTVTGSTTVDVTDGVVSVRSASIDTTQLSADVNASLDLADNSVQKTDYASDAAFGIAKVDGTTIKSESGVISLNYAVTTGSFTPTAGSL